MVIVVFVDLCEGEFGVKLEVVLCGEVVVELLVDLLYLWYEVCVVVIVEIYVLLKFDGLCY